MRHWEASRHLWQQCTFAWIDISRAIGSLDFWGSKLAVDRGVTGLVPSWSPGVQDQTEIGYTGSPSLPQAPGSGLIRLDTESELLLRKEPGFL